MVYIRYSCGRPEIQLLVARSNYIMATLATYGFVYVTTVRLVELRGRTGQPLYFVILQ
jgi:hypothetical protein